MRIVSAGGGSGGHVTPALAVLCELYRQDPDVAAYFITDRKFAAAASDIMAKAPFEVRIKRIYAGKLRRYHKVGFFRQLFDLPTVARNVRDVFLVGIGLLQSLRFLRRVKPDVVFTKGGFVCLPVGLAARLLNIPLVIHDSDAHPGLTNRMLAKYATVIGTGAPTENYNYPEGRTHYVGIPVDRAFSPVSAAAQQKLKAELGLHDVKKPLLVVTGGGLGARNINRAIATISSQLLDTVAILHLTGAANYQETVAAAPEHIDYIIKPFLPGLKTALGAADIVVTRAGATSLAELAGLAKPTIIIPNAVLPNGHQVKNAEVYAKAGAAVVLEEEKVKLDHRKLTRVILALASSGEKRAILGRKIHSFAKPDAALDMAALIAEAAAAKPSV
jgi:UDP-N-acetylglucosamine--N-acetylmuramyl-(pentapeptide) pyrophosphoryl-undecaprenol N-acetylglucosamine transferase